MKNFAFVTYFVVAVVCVVAGITGFWSTLSPYYQGNAGVACIGMIFLGALSGMASKHCHEVAFNAALKAVLGIFTVAAFSYGAMVYAIDHSSTLAKVAVMDSPVLPTCEEVYMNNMPLQSCTGKR